jgi:hypothetical protein
MNLFVGTGHKKIQAYLNFPQLTLCSTYEMNTVSLENEAGTGTWSLENNLYI